METADILFSIQIVAAAVCYLLAGWFMFEVVENVYKYQSYVNCKLWGWRPRGDRYAWLLGRRVAYYATLVCGLVWAGHSIGSMSL